MDAFIIAFSVGNILFGIGILIFWDCINSPLAVMIDWAWLMIAVPLLVYRSMTFRKRTRPIQHFSHQRNLDDMEKTLKDLLDELTNKAIVIGTQYITPPSEFDRLEEIKKQIIDIAKNGGKT